MKKVTVLVLMVILTACSKDNDSVHTDATQAKEPPKQYTDKGKEPEKLTTLPGFEEQE